MTLILNKDQVTEVLQMSDCIQVVEEAFKELSNNTAVLPLRSNIHSPNGISLYMPAFLSEMNALACKVVTVFKNNPERFNLPMVLGKVLLQDAESGEVICIMDGGYLTAVRTGAASGVATKYLARDEKNMCCGMIGTGVQARMQLLAINEVRDISKILVYDISRAAAEAFVNDMKQIITAEIIAVDHANDVLDADIVCTATSSPLPVFDGNKVKAGTHINGIGSHTPTTRELDTAILIRSKFVGDSREACFGEAGDFMIPLKEKAITEDHFYAELGDLILSKIPGRISKDEITIFKSNGLAVQDAATAKLVFEKAKEKGLGTEIRI